MPDIFLSYNRADQPLARHYAAALSAMGLDVWWDVALQTGEDYDRVTERALNSALAVVVLWSPRSVDSRWCRAEATVAQRNGSFVPVMVEACVRPVMFELTQTADLTGWAGDAGDPRWRGFSADLMAHLARRGGAAAPVAAVAVSAPVPAPVPAPSPAPVPAPGAAPAGGARRQVAILNCALAGDADADPEDWQEAVEAFHRLAIATSEPFDGRAQPAGGGLLILFGADTTREDDATRAVEAALALHAAMANFRVPGGGRAQARLGIDCGPVVVAPGKPPAGPALDGAAQLQTQAEPGSILVSPAVARLAGGYFVLDREGSRAFRVGGRSDTHSRFDLSRARGLSPFVGRGPEFAALSDALARTAAGEGQMIGLMAEAGSGKSRLCFEFTEHCRAEGVPVYRGSATQASRKAPLLPVLDMLREFFGIDTRDGAVARDRIEARALALDARLAASLPVMFDLLGVPDPARPAPPLEAEARQRQLVALVRHLFQLASAHHPVVMLVEDLHWLDDASAAFLEAMADQVASSRTLIIVNYRPEFRAPWMQNSACRQLTLPPLASDAVTALLDELLGIDPSVAVLKRPIADLTKGNPYFIEEIIQTLVETGRISGTRGDYRLEGAFDRLEVPLTVKAVVEARIDRLPPREKSLLQVAAVIGWTFAEPLLAAASGFAAAELAAALANLRRGEFIVEQSLFPVAEHGFKHPLTLEVSAATLVKAQRRQINAAVARAIEADAGDRADDQAARLAHHWEEAGEALVAAGWHQKAAERVVRTDFPTSAWHWKKVQDLARPHLPDPQAFGMMIAAAIQLLNMNYRVGIDREGAEAVLAEAQALAEAAGLPNLKLMLSVVFSRVLCGAADVTSYVALARENHAAAAVTDDPALKVISSILLSDALTHSARFREALDFVDACLLTWPRDTPRDYWITGSNPHSFFSFMRGVDLCWLGRLEDSRDQLAAAIRLATEDGTPEVAGWSYFQLATTAYLMGDPDAAMVAAQALEKLNETLGSRLLESYRLLAYTWAHLGRGDAAAAEPFALAAIDEFQRIERHWAGVGATLMARVQLAAGRTEDALRWAQQGRQLCNACEIRQYEIQALGVEALVHARSGGDLSRAQDALAEAGAIIERAGIEVCRPWLTEWHAELAAAQGHEGDARDLFTAAAEAHLAQGAPGHALRLKSRAA